MSAIQKTPGVRIDPGVALAAAPGVDEEEREDAESRERRNEIADPAARPRGRDHHAPEVGREDDQVQGDERKQHILREDA